MKKYVKVKKNVHIGPYGPGDIVELNENNKFWVRDKFAVEHFVSEDHVQTVHSTPEVLLPGPAALPEPEPKSTELTKSRLQK